MKTSTDRILTTHVGSLARPVELLDTMKEKEHGRPYDHALFDKQVREAVADRVRKQVENGIDIVTDGEMSKVSFLGYVKDRLGGFEVEEGGSGPAPSWQVEIDMFPEYYADYMSKYSAAVAPLRRIIARRKGNPAEPVLPERPRAPLPAARDVGDLSFPAVERPLVSIVIPTYGQPEYTRNCLASIPAVRTSPSRVLS